MPWTSQRDVLLCRHVGRIKRQSTQDDLLGDTHARVNRHALVLSDAGAAFNTAAVKGDTVTTTIMDQLRHKGKAAGKSAAGTRYTIRPTKGVPFGQLVSILTGGPTLANPTRGEYTVKVANLADFAQWAQNVGFEVAA